MWFIDFFYMFMYKYIGVALVAHLVEVCCQVFVGQVTYE